MLPEESSADLEDLNLLSDYEYQSYGHLFTDDDAAIYALYEQLFDSLNNICPQTILDAVKYLVWKNDMSAQLEEMESMTSTDVCVVHHRQLDKVEDTTTQEIKNKIYKVLEEEI